jgi:hypothetical protein
MGGPEMSGFAAGDMLFIVLVGGLIWGILFLVNRGRKAKKNKVDTSSSS